MATKAGCAARQSSKRSCLRVGDPAGAVAVPEQSGEAGEVWKPVLANA